MPLWGNMRKHITTVKSLGVREIIEMRPSEKNLADKKLIDALKYYANPTKDGWCNNRKPALDALEEIIEI